MKTETIEEAFEKWSDQQKGYDKLDVLRFGAKWQQEQYTIEEQHVGHTIDELDKEYIKGFNEGSACQQQNSYSEEEVLELLRKAHFVEQNIEEWFEQFKKK